MTERQRLEQPAFERCRPASRRPAAGCSASGVRGMPVGFEEIEIPTDEPGAAADRHHAGSPTASCCVDGRRRACRHRAERVRAALRRAGRSASSPRRRPAGSLPATNDADRRRQLAATETYGTAAEAYAAATWARCRRRAGWRRPWREPAVHLRRPAGSLALAADRRPGAATDARPRSASTTALELTASAAVNGVASRRRAHAAHRAWTTPSASTRRSCCARDPPPGAQSVDTLALPAGRVRPAGAAVDVHAARRRRRPAAAVDRARRRAVQRGRTSPLDLEPLRRAGCPCSTVPTLDELPPIDETWAWAHAQLTDRSGDGRRPGRPRRRCSRRIRRPA